MKTNVAVAALAWSVTTFCLLALYLLMDRYTGLTPLWFYMEAITTVRIAMTASIAVGVVALALAVVARGWKTQLPRGAFGLLAAAGAALGVSGGGWSFLVTQIAVQAEGGAPFSVVVFGYVEALLALSLGILAAAIALTGPLMSRSTGGRPPTTLRSPKP